jgi:hypothetical protein
MEGMKPDRKPLPVPIPASYATPLGIDGSFISHVNAGSKPLPFDKCVLLLKIARTDPYWSEVDLLGELLLPLHPELKPLLPFICKPKEETSGKQRKLSKKSR